MLKFLILFTAVPLLELYLLLAVGRVLGFWPTVGLVLVTGFLGASLAKREGWRVVRAWQRSLALGNLPEEGILGGLLVLVGGVLLITPGVLTDIVGLSFLLPWTRQLWLRGAGKLQERILRNAQAQATQRSWHVYGEQNSGRPRRTVRIIDIRDV